MRNSPNGRIIPVLAVAAAMLAGGTAEAKATGDALDKGSGKNPAAAASPKAAPKSPLEMCLDNVALAMSSIKLGLQSAEQESPDSCRSMGFQQAEAMRALRIAEEGSCNDPGAKTDERVPGALNYIKAKLAELSGAIDESCPQQALVTECEARLATVNNTATNGIAALYGEGDPATRCETATGLHALAKSGLFLAHGSCDSLTTNEDADEEEDVTPRADELTTKLEQTEARVAEMGKTISGVCAASHLAKPVDTKTE